MKKFVSSVALAAALATGSMAATAPSISTNNMGDFLIAPAFFANSGYETNLRVINTDLTHSVIMRVVVRDAVCSQEVDFPILLSPGDVWDATIYQGSDGTYIKSDDDSNYLPQLTTGNGLNLTKANTKAAGKFSAGYVEFYPIAQYNEGMEIKVPKAVLASRFVALEQGNTAGAEAVDNIVTGVVTLKNDAKILSMSLPMTAVADAAEQVNYGDEIKLTTDTKWENYFDDAAAVQNLFESSDVVVPFIDGENMALFTFVNDGTCKCPSTGNKQLRTFRAKIRDTAENKPIAPSPEPKFVIPNELGYITPVNILDAYQLTEDQKAAFSKGWIKMVDMKNVHCGQDGAGKTPAHIPTQLQAVQAGNGISTNWMYLPAE